jgi:hypothetical protein
MLVQTPHQVTLTQDDADAIYKQWKVNAAPLFAVYSQKMEEFKELEDKSEGLRQKSEGLRQKSEELRQKREVISQGLNELDNLSQKLVEADKGIQKVAKNRQDRLTKQFYSIFNGKKELPINEIDSLFDKYLADRSLSVEKNNEGESYPKINSMKPVSQYLTDNPNVVSCDFRSFKTEVHDIPFFADYLKTSTVKAIALKKDISDDAKASLAEAVAARNGTLKVQYFA